MGPPSGPVRDGTHVPDASKQASQQAARKWEVPQGIAWVRWRQIGTTVEQEVTDVSCIRVEVEGRAGDRPPHPSARRRGKLSIVKEQYLSRANACLV